MEIEPIGPSRRPPRIGNGVAEINGLGNVYCPEWVAAGPSEGDRSRSGDTVELADRVWELRRARQAVEDAPDVRADKVAAIRRRLADGTYDVSPERLASKLLGAG